MNADSSSPRSAATRSLHRSHGSFELAFAPVLMALAGLWLDRTVGTVPVFTLVFAAVGISGAFTKIYFGYRSSMTAMSEQSVWARHASSEEFRKQARARADRLATPLESASSDAPSGGSS
jgi:F0F1-type ATP synthase assembly protein I